MTSPIQRSPRILRTGVRTTIFPKVLLLVGSLLTFCATTAIPSPAQTLTTLYSFCPGGPPCTDGSAPIAALAQATDGNFYGTTSEGPYGTVFKITPNGSLITLYSFCSQPNCADGAQPYAGLVQATDGNFYGTTFVGGVDQSGAGTIFRITPSGALTTVYTFCPHFQGCPDGANPEGTLVQATDGNLYGTTEMGGTGRSCSGGCGVVFKITLSGALTTLYSFNGTDGARPYAGLVQATDGNLYGTTYEGGGTNNDCMNGCGTVFKITPSGTFTTLHSFNFSDGYLPDGGLIQATDGNIYGVTAKAGLMVMARSSRSL
jgi:uncharacterized repeat protein (TIGR03803 family)